MDVRTCKGCGRIYNHLGGPVLCPNCKQALEDKFQQVKGYIYDHKDAPVQEVAEQNDVTVQQIRQWVREERLQFSDDSAVGLECENCGTMIRSGRFCTACKEKLANGLNSMFQTKEPEKKKTADASARMRFLDNN